MLFPLDSWYHIIRLGEKFLETLNIRLKWNKSISTVVHLTSERQSNEMHSVILDSTLGFMIFNIWPQMESKF